MVLERILKITERGGQRMIQGRSIHRKHRNPLSETAEQLFRLFDANLLPEQIKGIGKGKNGDGNLDFSPTTERKQAGSCLAERFSTQKKIKDDIGIDKD